MVVTYRNNRLVPAVIIATCILLIFWLVDPSVENYGHGTQTGDASLRVGSDDREAHPPPQRATSAPLTGEQQADVGHGAAYTYQPRPTAAASQGQGGNVAEDDGIVLIMKTGGTTMWKRLLVHLTTTFARDRIAPSNLVIYSDYPEQIGDFTLIDALANMTDEAKQAPDFEVWRQQPLYSAHNVYVEAAGVSGDDWGPTGGWIIDKYKFVPLMQHAGEHWPRAKWYVYMEDDAYLFLPSVRRYLAGFDWRRPHWLGSYAAKSGVVFAQGGAGFALSRAAWEASFGREPGMAAKYYNYTADHCCGDQVLGQVLNDYGVRFGENGGEELFTWGFNPLVHWNFVFSKHNWCAPLMSWHKTHNRDVARYYELERKWDFSVRPWPLVFSFLDSLDQPRLTVCVLC
jgi:hypothetical protein